MRIGYARVSTADQRLDLQHEALDAAGCERIFDDTTSGGTPDRPGLSRLLDQLRKGDTLVVWKLDRLGRGVKQVVDLMTWLDVAGVDFVSLTEAIDTSTPLGRFIFHIMASLAEMERELVAERTRAGLESARQRGRIGGRKPVMTEAKVDAARKLLASGTPPREVAESLGVSIATLYRWVPANREP